MGTAKKDIRSLRMLCAFSLWRMKLEEMEQSSGHEGSKRHENI